MLRRTCSQLAVILVLVVLHAQPSWAQTSGGIKWLSDLSEGHRQARQAKLPLVIYVYSADEKGPLPNCSALESGALASREIQLYQNSAVFVRLNFAVDDASGNVSRLLKERNVTQVPYVSVAECAEGRLIHEQPIIGNIPTSDFVHALRGDIISVQLSVRGRETAAATDAEYLRAIDAFRPDYRQLQAEFKMIYDARTKQLDKLRDAGEFQLEEFLAAERLLADVQTRIVRRLLTFAESQSAEIRTFCRYEIEIHAELSDAAYWLKQDLMAQTVNGKLDGTTAVIIAQSLTQNARKETEKELQRLCSLGEKAGLAMDQRYSDLIRNAGQVVKR